MKTADTKGHILTPLVQNLQNKQIGTEGRLVTARPWKKGE